MKCQFCNAQIEADSVFCTSCGRKQESKEQTDQIAPAFCTTCGAKLQGGDLFCTSCGTKIEGTGTPGLTEPIKPQWQVEPQNKHEAVGKNAAKGSRAGIIAACVVLLFVLLGGTIFGVRTFLVNREVTQEERTEEDKSETAQKDKKEETTGQSETEQAERTNAAVTGQEVLQDTEQEEETGSSETISEQTAPEVSMGDILNVSATSALSEYDMTHSPERVLDGDLSTAWVEGADGQGIGEGITILLDDVYLVSGFTIYAGYQKSEELYRKNSRPAVLRLVYSNGDSEKYDLADENDEQTIQLRTPVQTSSVTFVIEEVYPGNQYEDTVISEIELY